MSTNGSQPHEAEAPSRRAPLTIENLDARLRELEIAHQDRDSGEIDALKAELEALRASHRRMEVGLDAANAKIDTVVTKLNKLDEAVGESPDDAAGTPGKGIKKTLSEMVRAAKSPAMSAHIAAAGTAVMAAYEILKRFGILK